MIYVHRESVIQPGKSHALLILTWFRTFDDSLRTELADNMFGGRIHGQEIANELLVAWSPSATSTGHRLPDEQ